MADSWHQTAGRTPVVGLVMILCGASMMKSITSRMLADKMWDTFSKKRNFLRKHMDVNIELDADVNDDAVHMFVRVTRDAWFFQTHHTV